MTASRKAGRQPSTRSGPRRYHQMKGGLQSSAAVPYDWSPTSLRPYVERYIGLVALHIRPTSGPMGLPMLWLLCDPILVSGNTHKSSGVRCQQSAGGGKRRLVGGKCMKVGFDPRLRVSPRNFGTPHQGLSPRYCFGKLLKLGSKIIAEGAPAWPAPFRLQYRSTRFHAIQP